MTKARLLRLLLWGVAASAALPVRAAERPNIIHIVGDDIGYDDIGPFGGRDIPTMNLDRLAEQGMKLTRFYAPSSTCTPTRMALLTGSYAPRAGVPGVLFPFATSGIADSEITIAELLRDEGYATALIGKWHLGHLPPFLPTRHGFDTFFGIPYPNDFEPGRVIWEWGGGPGYRPPPLPLYRDETLVEEPTDLVSLPHRITAEAVRFIRKNRDRPFFLHLAPVETHTPYFVSPRFVGFTEDCGAYCDAMVSVDWTVGEIEAILRHLGLEERTLVVFSSDNGPLIESTRDLPGIYGRYGTTNAARPHELRGGKNSAWEGGVRVGAVAWWPGRIPPGAVSDEVVAGFDLFTTFALLGGAEVPNDRVIDGRDIRPILFCEPGARSPHEAFYYYQGERLVAVRSGRWKLMMGDPQGLSSMERQWAEELPPESLFDLAADPREMRSVLDQHPEVADTLRSLAEKARDDIGDAATGRAGRHRRPGGRVPSPDTAP
jgi:arylsulfatase A-like enzyme